MTEKPKGPDVSPEAAAQILRVRLLLGACAILWAIWTGLVLGGDLMPAAATAEEIERARVGFIGGTLLSTAGATVLRPGKRSSWAVAVIAAMAQMTTCILTPISAYLLYLLFRPQVMRACISRVFGEPTDMR